MQEVNLRYRARVDPLVNQLDDILEKQDASFEGREKQIVKMFLDSDVFKKMISISYGADQLIARNDNVVSIVTVTLSLFSALVRAYRTPKKTIDDPTEATSDEGVLDALRQKLTENEARFGDSAILETKDLAQRFKQIFETVKSKYPSMNKYQDYDESRHTIGFILKWWSIYTIFPTRLLDKLIKLNEIAALFAFAIHWSDIAK